MTSRRTWTVWSVGLLAYIVAVLHRTSLGVSGVDAAERLDVGASAVGSLAVLQLLVYAAMQVPVGVLLDRFGPRRLLTVGAAVMAVGQLVMALAGDVPTAAAARALVGVGDAMTFVSVLRLVAVWFPSRRVPVMTQVTGLTGQLGQVASAVPFLAVLSTAGWGVAFAGTAVLGAVVAVTTALVVRDAPPGDPAQREARPAASVVDDVRSAWRHPGTRLGLWSHFVTQFPGLTFALLWGYPFLVSGEGVSPAAASALLSTTVVVGVVVGPALGVLVQRHPLRRSWLVLGVVATSASTWTVVLAWPGRAPLWLLVALVASLAVTGPGSMIGFDFARTFNPVNRLGTATGIVNVGGFTATLVTIFAIGLVLDLRGVGAVGADLGDWRLAMSTQYAVWAVGVTGVLVSRRRVRARMATHGVVVPPIRDAVARNRAARRRRR